jgi:hypothetical protein
MKLRLKIERALKRGLTPKQVAARYGISVPYVYAVRREMRATQKGLVTLQPEVPQPTAGLGSIPLGVVEVKEDKVEEPAPPLTRWQRLKMWFWGRA